MNKSQILVLTFVFLAVLGRVSVSCWSVPNNSPAKEVQKESEEDDDPLTPMELAGIKSCENNETLMELCARCTKATKARNVYPMCCLNADAVGDWCRDFVYFGIQ